MENINFGNSSISLDQINRALPNIKEGLNSYLWLQHKSKYLENFRENREFTKKYNAYYRVRRGQDWQKYYYDLMAESKIKKYDYFKILNCMYNLTKRYEASFSSKLFATLNPEKPIIDRFVLANLNLKLPSASNPQRIDNINKIYQEIIKSYNDVLQADEGRYLVERFDAEYPSVNVTNVKKIDFILWKIR